MYGTALHNHSNVRFPQFVVCPRNRRWIRAVVFFAVFVAVASGGASDELRGAYFNPQTSLGSFDPRWIRDYHKCVEEVNAELAELVRRTGINFIDIQLLIPFTLKETATPPADDAESITGWANMTTLDNLVTFLDYCSGVGVSVEIDLANNMWIPFLIDTKNHIANSGWWPKPDETPWTESVVWYAQIIEYVERKVQHPEAIALWNMFGNYHFGGAEPVLWNTWHRPDIIQYTERFVKHVWPAFRKTGKRPKGAPMLLPIFADNSYWRDRTPEDRLSAFSNLKRWIVDELKMPPDY